MKKLTTIFSFLAVLLVLQSCSPRVVTSRPNDADLSKYESFAYLPNATLDVEDGKFNTEKVNTRLVQILNRQMMDAGYELDRDRPDLLVILNLNTNTEVATDREPVYANYPYDPYNSSAVSPYYNDYYYRDYVGYNGIVGYEYDTYTYKEGSVVVTLIDRKTRSVVWRGATADDFYNQSNTTAMMDLVKNIFEEYPLENTARR